MKQMMTSKSVYFLMEVIIVILFFALCATGCLQLLMKAQANSQFASDARIAMREGTTILETMKVDNLVPDSFTFHEDERAYDVTIDSSINEDGLNVGTLTITCEEKTLLTLPFAIAEVAR